MKSMMVLLFVCFPLAFPFAVSAAEAPANACLMEGKFTLVGKAFDIKDCVQNDGDSHEHLVKACDGIAQMAVALGAPPPKTSWLPACPAKPQARCIGMAGSRLTAYYYKRSPEQLASSRPGCERTGGHWADGG